MMQTPEPDRPAALIKLFQDKRISKGDLAQHVAGVIEADAPFTVPPYLQAAINAATA